MNKRDMPGLNSTPFVVDLKSGQVNKAPYPQHQPDYVTQETPQEGDILTFKHFDGTEESSIVDKWIGGDYIWFKDGGCIRRSTAEYTITLKMKRDEKNAND